MVNKSLAATVFSAALLAVSGCDFLSALTKPQEIPPGGVPLGDKTFKLSDLGVSVPSAKTEPFPAFPASGEPKNLPDDTGISVPVPEDAKKQVEKFDSAKIAFKFANTIPAPLSLNVYIAKGTIDWTKPPVVSLRIDAGGATAKDSTGDATFSKELITADSVRLGFRVSSVGTKEPVSIDPNATLKVSPRLSIFVKL